MKGGLPYSCSTLHVALQHVAQQIFCRILTANTLWWMMMKTCHIMMREHGMWEISIEAKLKISCEESEMEHSLFERAANKAATPALLCMYSNL